MNTHSISLEDLHLEYIKYGDGPEIIIALHGHGKHASDFDFMHDARFTVLSINLFLHGGSTFGAHRLSTQILTKNDVEKLLEKLFKHENIDHFHVVAYSQGGRFVLTVLPYFARRIKSLTLLAPDGLNDKNFYSWSQRRWWARKLFQRWTHRPKELIGIASFLSKIKIIHPKIVDFLQHYSSDEQRFKRAYQSWSAFRKLRPNRALLKATFEKHPIPFKLVIGEFDRIITLESAMGFVQAIHQEAALITIPTGHDFFREDTLPYIQQEIFYHLEENISHHPTPS
jgi:pimeloyl-ACP methyl ester carboxylesterase